MIKLKSVGVVVIAFGLGAAGAAETALTGLVPIVSVTPPELAKLSVPSSATVQFKLSDDGRPRAIKIIATEGGPIDISLVKRSFMDWHFKLPKIPNATAETYQYVWFLGPHAVARHTRWMCEQHQHEANSQVAVNQTGLCDISESTNMRIYRMEARTHQSMFGGCLSCFAVLEFDITSEGMVDNPRVVESNAPEELENAALRAVRHWLFESKDGKPLPASGRQRFNFHKHGSAKADPDAV